MIEYVTSSVAYSVPYETKTVKNYEEYEGYVKVLVTGVEGVAIETTVQGMKDGEPYGEPKVTRTIQNRPITEVIEVGAVEYEDGEGVDSGEGGEYATRYTASSNPVDFVFETSISSLNNVVGARNITEVILEGGGKEVVKISLTVGESIRGASLLSRDSLKVGVLTKNGTMSTVLEEFSEGLEDFSWELNIERIGRAYGIKVWRVNEETGEYGKVQFMQVLDEETVRDLYIGEITHVEVRFKEFGGLPTTDVSVGKLELRRIEGKGVKSHFKRGDKVLVNNKLRRVIKGREPIGELKEPLSSYIGLANGVNKIEVLPRKAFKGVIRYRNEKM